MGVKTPVGLERAGGRSDELCWRRNLYCLSVLSTQSRIPGLPPRGAEDPSSRGEFHGVPWEALAKCER